MQPHLTNHDRVILAEAKRRVDGTPAVKHRGGMTRSRYRRMLRRGDHMYDWMRPPEPKIQLERPAGDNTKDRIKSEVLHG